MPSKMNPDSKFDRIDKARKQRTSNIPLFPSTSCSPPSTHSVSRSCIISNRIDQSPHTTGVAMSPRAAKVPLCATGRCSGHPRTPPSSSVSDIAVKQHLSNVPLFPPTSDSRPSSDCASRSSICSNYTHLSPKFTDTGATSSLYTTKAPLSVTSRGHAVDSLKNLRTSSWSSGSRERKSTRSIRSYLSSMKFFDINHPDNQFSISSSSQGASFKVVLFLQRTTLKHSTVDSVRSRDDFGAISFGVYLPGS